MVQQVLNCLSAAQSCAGLVKSGVGLSEKVVRQGCRRAIEARVGASVAASASGMRGATGAHEDITLQ